jgi:aspartyl-tRNA(Asn)/glutamyl-tRNA(Gln) amidotransferase subunit C
MALSPEEVEHIADLARLQLSPEEKDHFRQQLSAILEYVASLQTLETGDISPTSSVLPPRSVLRADDPRLGLSPEEVLKNAPKTGKGQFRLPPVFE